MQVSHFTKGKSLYRTVTLFNKIVDSLKFGLVSFTLQKMNPVINDKFLWSLAKTFIPSIKASMVQGFVVGLGIL
jgi:hypothetical protein